MPPAVAIATYRCDVDGRPDGSVDVQVRYFRSFDPTSIEARLRSEQPHSYMNAGGETVTWSLAAVLAVEPLDAPSDGSEIAGAIFGAEQLTSWTRS